MNLDTPLEEVAHHLPPGAASFLGDQVGNVQIRVLMTVRLIVTNLEEGGIRFDPMQYDVLLATIVPVLTSMACDSYNLQYRLAQIQNLSQEGP